MTIQDCRILTGICNAYIACPAKKGKVMLEPRRIITEKEILNLILWWIDKRLSGNKTDTLFIRQNGERIIELKRLKKYDI